MYIIYKYTFKMYIILLTWSLENRLMSLIFFNFYFKNLINFILYIFVLCYLVYTH